MSRLRGDNDAVIKFKMYGAFRDQYMPFLDCESTENVYFGVDFLEIKRCLKGLLFDVDIWTITLAVLGMF